MNIAVIGTGYVGLVSGTCFAEVGNNVICCDIDEEKIGQLLDGKIPIYEPGLKELVDKNTQAGRLSFTTDIGKAIESSDVIFIAVGTPMLSDGNADLQYVENVARFIGDHLNRYKVIVVKSTVPVGTVRSVKRIISSVCPDVPFDVASNPEFLKEGSAVHDCLHMERAVIGVESEKAAEILTELHRPFNTEILVMDIESAEITKYASNAFLATKISFINDIAKLCDRVGADVTKVAEGMGLDARIGKSFLQAGVGFGGSCFPKDTSALVKTASNYGLDFKIVQSAIEINEQQPYVIIDKLHSIFPVLDGLQIAVLGLTFKPNTDDMRYAPSLKIIPELDRLGASVRGYDPVGYKGAQQLLGDRVICSDSIEDTLQDADVCVILTEWKQIKEMDLPKAKELMKMPIIVDGRNCFDLNTMRETGFVYHSVGRPAVNDLQELEIKHGKTFMTAKI